MSFLPKKVDLCKQKDIQILWNDDHLSYYEARPLRLACKCADCINEITGEPILNPRMVPDSVAPEKMSYVGRYAITIQWTDSHRTGIYSFDYLRKICPCDICQKEREKNGTAPKQA